MLHSLFFDLDHTLWDYNANANATLLFLYNQYSMQESGVDSYTLFTTTFMEVNEALWKDFDANKIDKDGIRELRFYKIFEKICPALLPLSQEVSRVYLERCPKMGSLMPHGKTILEYLSQKYELSIITNGFNDTQFIKLEHAGIHHFFTHVITSDTCGYKKPSAEVFDYALKLSGFSKENVLYVGDNFHTDILGAKGAGWDTVYFNPQNKTLPSEYIPTHTIECLSELSNIL